MNNKFSFYDLLTGGFTGTWCNGLAMVNIEESSFSITNIYRVNGNEISLNGYPIETKEKVFSKVKEMNYELAFKELVDNKKTIISPCILEQIITFDGIRELKVGGNVFSCSDDETICVNDKHKFNSFEQIIYMGFVSEEEKKKIWLVF